eukprot:scaffold22.g6081.t1
MAGRYKYHAAGSSQQQQGGVPTCQKCLQQGHWTYECKGERVYIARPTRTQQLKNPRARPHFLEASELPPELRDKEKKERKGGGGRGAAADERRRKRKRRSPSSSSSSSSSSGGSSSSSGSSSGGSSSSGSSSSDSGSSSDASGSGSGTSRSSGSSSSGTSSGSGSGSGPSTSGNKKRGGKKRQHKSSASSSGGSGSSSSGSSGSSGSSSSSSSGSESGGARRRRGSGSPAPSKQRRRSAGEGVRDPDAERASFSDAVKWLQACTSLNYWLNIYQRQQETGEHLKAPPELPKIVELMHRLPAADMNTWRSLGKGKVPKKAQQKGEPRSKWDEDKAAELVRLVDDEAYRTAQIGKNATRSGKCNWAAVSRHFGFVAPSTVQKKYNALKGIVEAPKEKKKRAAAEEGEGVKARRLAGPQRTKPSPCDAPCAACARPACRRAPAPTPGSRPPFSPCSPPLQPASPAKKQKPAEAKSPVKKEKAAAPAAPVVTPVVASGWTAELSDKLVQLVDDKKYRKEATGHKKLKYKRIAKELGHDKKECKRQYKKVTGRDAPEEEGDDD